MELAEATFGPAFVERYDQAARIRLGNICFSFRNGLVIFDAHRQDDQTKIRRLLKDWQSIQDTINELSPRAQLDFIAIEERIVLRFGSLQRKTPAGIPFPTYPSQIIPLVFTRLERLHRAKRMRGRTDWYAAAAAKDCAEIWSGVTGTPAPTFVHHDALGPFGTFLQDALDIVAGTYRPSRPPPSAATAMRALAEINRSRA
jgi:hypothetical protein